MLIVRLVGIAVQKLALNEQVSLYTETKNQEKVEAAKKQLQALNDESERIKKTSKANSQSSRTTVLDKVGLTRPPFFMRKIQKHRFFSTHFGLEAQTIK